MSRSVYLGYARHGRADKQAEVVHSTEVWSTDDRKDLAGLIALLCQAEAVLTADGIDPADVRFDLDYDREPDYGEDRIVPKVTITGRRPATEAEVASARALQEQATQRAKADTLARLRAQLAEAQGRA